MCVVKYARQRRTPSWRRKARTGRLTTCWSSAAHRRSPKLFKLSLRNDASLFTRSEPTVFTAWNATWNFHCKLDQSAAAFPFQLFGAGETVIKELDASKRESCPVRRLAGLQPRRGVHQTAFSSAPPSGGGLILFHSRSGKARRIARPRQTRGP